jgi:hypothetical protein
MSQCDLCGKYAEELWAVPGEKGKTEFACEDCVPKPSVLDVTGEPKLRCPVCQSVKYQEVSDRYWFHREGGLFLCEHQHLFTVRFQIRTLTEEVWIPDD